jgi:hypothetical protein
VNRQYLISDTTIRVIKRELDIIEQYTVYTPESNACFKAIRGTLENLKGA